MGSRPFELQQQPATRRSSEDEEQPLIPGLPDEVAVHCLLHLPFPELAVARSVSSAWKHAISSPFFLQQRKALSLSQPYLFVLAFRPTDFQIRWQAFDPRTRRWLALPAMPLPGERPGDGGGLNDDGGGPVSPSAFACASVPDCGELFVLGGMRAASRTPLRTVLSYRASTNSWSINAPMPTPRAYFAAGSVGGSILAAGGIGETGQDVCSVEKYDTAAGQWGAAPGMRNGMSRYDAAVVKGRMYVTEGWTWPFDNPPRGMAYEDGKDGRGGAWGEMRPGMREGWTGSSAVVDGRLFVVSEYGDGRVKVYDEGKDEWEKVEGSGMPHGLRKPMAVAGTEEGRIYVVAAGLSVAVGTVTEVVEKKQERKRRWKVEWEVVQGPEKWKDLSPSSSHVLYA